MYIDSDVLYALLKESDWLKEYANTIALMSEEKYTSTIALVELSLVVKRDLGEEFSILSNKILLEKLPKLKILPLTEKIFEQSNELRKKHGLGIFDAIHAATALSKDKKIASSDLIYNKISELKRIQK